MKIHCLTLAAYPVLSFCVLASAAAQAAPADPVVEAAVLPAAAAGWHLWHGDVGKVESTDKGLKITPQKGTNFFHSPDGKYNITSAPVVYTLPQGDFLFTAKVNAQLVSIFDVAALILYQDDDHWAKLCFENSVRQEATIVSVVTRGRSDDNNSETIASPFVYLAVARKGNEYSFHFSRDGKQWRLARHFAMEFAPGLKLGLAAHSPYNPQFSVTFTDVVLRPEAPANMRRLDVEEMARH